MYVGVGIRIGLIPGWRLGAPGYLEREIVTANLYEMQTRAQLALEAAGLGVWSWNIATDALEWDERTTRIWGMPPGAVLTMSAIDVLVHSEDRERKQKSLRHALDPVSDGMYNAEYRIIGYDTAKIATAKAKG